MHLSILHIERVEIKEKPSATLTNNRNLGIEMMLLKCELCNYNCSNKGSLKRHVASVHEHKKPFKCEICDYSCS